jgi:hypothetical protein
MDILDKARAGQNALERIANAIPGFKGYRERELRRDADKLQREHLALRLEDAKRVLNELANAATRAGSLDSINGIETARKRLDKAAARLRYADRGYAGFFDAVKVDEATLGRVYEFGAGLISDVEAVRGASEPAPMIAALDALDRRLDERESLLRGIQ